MNYRDNPFNHTRVHRTDPTGRHQILHDPYAVEGPFVFAILGAALIVIAALAVYLWRIA